MSPKNLSPKDLDHEFDYSRQISGPLISCILRQDTSYSPEVLNAQLTAKSEVGRQRRENLNSSSSSLYNTLPQDLKRAVDLATEKGASSWLSTLPIQEHGFALHKAAFHDAVALRYGWIPSNVPVECACGKSFSVEHALSCAKGGFPSLRHNEVRDITASLISEVCSNVCTEPTLNPVSGQNLPLQQCSDGALQLTFFDVRVFNPLAPFCNMSEKRSGSARQGSVWMWQLMALLGFSTRMLLFSLMFFVCCWNGVSGILPGG